VLDRKSARQMMARAMHLGGGSMLNEEPPGDQIGQQTHEGGSRLGVPHERPMAENDTTRKRVATQLYLPSPRFRDI